MLRIPPCDLPEPAATKLRAWQAEVDGYPDYETRVSAAARLFHSRNQAHIPTFATVRATLAGMCPGAQRCMYCEDSAGNQVEHFHPKSLYPNYVFTWLNFLCACEGCNGPKNDGFAIMDAGQPICVTRKPRAPMIPPPPGPPALLDPRQDDLMAFLEIDLPETFLVQPRLSLSALAKARADYTIRALRLNKREYLVKARRHAYRSLESLLAQYVRRRDDRSEDLVHIEREIRVAPHPAVWFEMRRQHLRIEALRHLFEQVPQALAWDWQPDVG